MPATILLLIRSGRKVLTRRGPEVGGNCFNEDVMPKNTLLLVPLLLGLSQEALRAQAPADSVVYHLDPGSRLVVKTGKAGLFGFAGHSHVIRARSMTGALGYYPDKRASHLRIKVPADSREVLTPPNTAEIRKVTEAMR